MHMLFQSRDFVLLETKDTKPSFFPCFQETYKSWQLQRTTD